jgi:hypothetical protein
MELLDKKFTNILDFIENPVSSHHSGDKPVCYLTFDVEEIINVKKGTTGFRVETFKKRLIL